MTIEQRPVTAGSRGGRMGRPPASTHEDIERTAIAMWLEHGYENVSVEQIAAACGIGRATFFRYFATKADVVWVAFDHAIDRLAASLAEHRRTPLDAPGTIDAIRRAVVASTSGSVEESSVWLERFELLNSAPALRAGTAEHWATWTRTVAGFVAARTGQDDSAILPWAIAGAVQATYLATLRAWSPVTTDPAVFLAQLDENMARVGSSLTGLVLPD